MGNYIVNGFNNNIGQLEAVKAIRGLGLLIGIELACDQLAHDCASLVKLALQKQILINVTAGNVIRLLPPLIINREQADIIINTVSELVTGSLQKSTA